MCRLGPYFTRCYEHPNTTNDTINNQLSNADICLFSSKEQGAVFTTINFLCKSLLGRLEHYRAQKVKPIKVEPIIVEPIKVEPL